MLCNFKKINTKQIIAYSILYSLAIEKATAEQALNSADDLFGLSLEELLTIKVHSRLPESDSTIPGTFTIINQESIDKQRAIFNDLGFILSSYVPSLSPSTMTAFNRSTTIHGRKMAILINGVPIDTPLRTGDQALRSLDASVLQSIEVMHGANTLYGVGSSGGTINYITKDTEQDSDIVLSSELAKSAALAHTKNSGSASLVQSLKGSVNNLSFFASAFYEQVDGFFDAEGDRIPSKTAGNSSIGLPESKNINLYSKLAYNWQQQRVAFNALYYEHAMEDIYETVGGDVISRTKATAVRTPAKRNTEDPGSKNLVLNLIYEHQAIFGSTFHAQTYYQDYDNIFGAFIENSPLVRSTDMVGQSTITSRKHGLRFDFNTPLAALFYKQHASLDWGIDILRDKTGQTLLSGSIGGDTWTPFMTMTQYAPFIQFQSNITKRLSTRAGLRNEHTQIKVDDFNTVFDGHINGGKVTFQKTSLNIGLVYKLTDSTDIFAGVSEGYDVPEVGRVLRNTSNTIEFDSIDVEAVDNRSTEIGIRIKQDNFSFSFTAYRSTSDLGLQLTAVPGTDLLTPEQTPESIEGLELTTQYHYNKHWITGGTFSWLEGERDTDTGTEYLSGQRIPPPKVTAYVEYKLIKNALIRFQALYSGKRNRFPDDIGNGEQFKGEVHSFTTFDLLSRYQLNNTSITLAIHNLFNKDYFTVFSQSSNLDRRVVKAPGRMINLTFKINY
ncbi:TonB-dependent receptor [Endozoicomonas sp. SM1973]|uniref:TonB-dependent receptor n=1 Tax=Spartinivicinus marinus TaxID=2994442 RepID=A0A853IBH5_9GAMM|nr:TonB-dependent receptor [Spartinivicinus marinus]MCX4028472.1 TonB-dependent receptor [Spartinivicinus marinus]NYZ67414.1 TonB-dependent receptor [Spartinivicinus marinus]